MKILYQFLAFFSLMAFLQGATLLAPDASTKIAGFRMATMDKGVNNPFGLIAGDVLLQADKDKMTSLEAAQKFYANPHLYEKIKILRKGKEIYLSKVVNEE